MSGDEKQSYSGYLESQMLIAMPGMADPASPYMSHQ